MSGRRYENGVGGEFGFWRGGADAAGSTGDDVVDDDNNNNKNDNKNDKDHDNEDNDNVARGSDQGPHCAHSLIAEQ